MYIDYFELKEEPFNLAPDPAFFYASEGQTEALARLQYGIDLRKGLILLTGEVGSGKTTVLQTLMANQKANQKTALIVNPRIVGNRLIQNICREFGIELDFSQISRADVLNILYEYILKKSFYDQNFTVIVDDAHELDREQFDDVLLLTKIETSTRQLLQVILVGLPVLHDRLKSPELLPLYQRIQIQYHLRAFTYYDTQNYILHRLAKAGREKQDIFKADAIQRIYQLSGGIPRTISVIASNALLYAFLNKIKKIDYKVINSSTDESLQTTADKQKTTLSGRLNEKFPPRIEYPPVRPGRKRSLLKWVLITSAIILILIGLNILAQYLISYFNLF
jgi:general secretion pathway protein A